MITNTQTVRRYQGPFTEGQKIYFDIPFIEEADLKLSIDDTPLTFNSNYTVQAIKSEGLITGANITILQAYPSANVLVVQRDTALTQEQDYPENGPFESIDIERSFDKLTMKDQEIEYREKRYIKISDVEPDSFDSMLPPAIDTPSIVTIQKGKVDLAYVDPNEIKEAIEQAKEEANSAAASATSAKQAATESAAAADRAGVEADRAEAAANRAEEIALPSGQNNNDVLTWNSASNKPVWNAHIATSAVAGFVKPDGVSTFIKSDGTISSKVTDPYVLPIATKDRLGGVKVDNKTIFVAEDGTLSARAGIIVNTETPPDKAVATPQVLIEEAEQFYFLYIHIIDETNGEFSLRVPVAGSVFPSAAANKAVTFTSEVSNRKGNFRNIAQDQLPLNGFCPVWMSSTGSGTSMFVYGNNLADLESYAGSNTEKYIYIGDIQVIAFEPTSYAMYHAPSYVKFE